MISNLIEKKLIGQDVSVLNQLMTGKSLIVRLRNVHTGEYLYAAADDQARDAQRRSVFTWRLKNETVGSWADWKMTGSFTQGSFHVHLSTRKYGDELLFVPDEEKYLYDKDPVVRRYVYTWRHLAAALPDDGSADWYLEPDFPQKEPSVNRYALLNVKSNEYIYPLLKMKDVYRRPLITWGGPSSSFVVFGNLYALWDVEIISVTI